MPTPTRYGKTMHNVERADQQVEQLSLGGALTVFHKNTKVATTNPTQANIFMADGTVDANLICVRNTLRLPWLVLYPIVAGATLPTTDLAIRAFGRVDDMPRGNGDRQLPSDFDTTNFGEDRGDFFALPLFEQGTSEPDVITFDTTVLADHNPGGGVKRFRLLTPRVVFVDGASEIATAIVTVHDAGDACMLLGRFTHGSS